MKINSNYNFWTYEEVLELSKNIVVPGAMKMVIEGNQLRLSAEDIDARRKNISVYNQVERLNKHPSLFINYLKLLATNKGMGFTIDQGEPEATTAKTKDARVNYRLESILKAPNLTFDEYQEIAARKKQGKTTTEENFKADRFFWQRYLVQKEPDPDLLLEFIYDNNPLDNFLGLIDVKNHKKEDNLRSAKFLERVSTVDRLLRGLGFGNAVDREKIERDAFLENWTANIVGDETFKSKRICEIFNLAKSKKISEEMNPRQILLWANILLKPFGLVIRADHANYCLKERFDIQGLIKRKNSVGKFYIDGKALLKQELPSPDLFIDETTGVVMSTKPKKKIDTTRLDIDIDMD